MTENPRQDRAFPADTESNRADAFPVEGEWRQDRNSTEDTFYPGIRFGMTPDKVRSCIPKNYRVRQEGDSLFAERTRADGTKEEIQFDFEDGRLVNTQDTVF